MKQLMTIVAGLSLLSTVAGCALDPGASALEDNLQTATQDVAIGQHYEVYAFYAGIWRKADYLWPATTSPTTVTMGFFGASDDLPFLWEDGSQTKIGTYGTSSTRLGYFYFDDYGDMSWGPGDGAGVKFRSDAQSGDKPFVVTATRWARNSSGQCAPSESNGIPVEGRMVGIKRGTTVYLDRDGDGVWGAANHCDLTGTIGLAADSPAVVGNILALTRVSGTNRTWYYDTNLDLSWAEPPDRSSAVNAFGDASQFVPFTHPACIATSSGTTVLHDRNCDGAWQTSDSIYTSALPSTAWKLAGVNAYTVSIIK